MTEDRTRGIGLHATTEDLALLAEGRLGEERAAPLRAHLARCRSCISAYADAVRTRHDRLTGRAVAAVPADLVRLGLEIPGVRRAHEGRPSWFPFPRFPSRRLALGVGALAVAALVLRLSLLTPDRALTPEGVAPIREAVLSLSMKSGESRGFRMVLPGGEESAGTRTREAETYRGEDREELRRAVDRLAARYGEDAGSEELTFWLLTGLVTTSQLSDARPYLDRARLDFPESRRIAILEAVALYKESRLDESETLLREILADEPDEPLVLLDLGILLEDRAYAKRDPEEARELFRRVEASRPGSPLAERARLERESLEHGAE